ncbi:unnamed protein product [Chironomus riparius]|uniref:Distal membrane-arm assembly complex protein 1-like domain-containing protein n=1 Tax=Chironomus riparius TaxID=315576 RepID=A0A9N9WR11_9DIPT|nr:unnamed protein product [Chironomus riparius]
MTAEQNDNDCLGCRLASAGGLYIASVYIYRQSLGKTRLNRNGMILISTAFGLAGTVRLFNLYPKRKQQARVNIRNDDS